MKLIREDDKPNLTPIKAFCCTREEEIIAMPSLHEAIAHLVSVNGKKLILTGSNLIKGVPVDCNLTITREDDKVKAKIDTSLPDIPQTPGAISVEVYLRSAGGSTFYTRSLGEGLIHLTSQKGARCDINWKNHAIPCGKMGYELHQIVLRHSSDSVLTIEFASPYIECGTPGEIWLVYPHHTDQLPWDKYGGTDLTIYEKNIANKLILKKMKERGEFEGY